MKFDSQPRNSNDKPNPLRNLLIPDQQPFYTLLKQLVSAVSKDSSNNVAIVAIAAMFFALAMMLVKPATPVANPPVINVNSNPTTTVTNHQKQNQRIDDVDRGL